MPRYDRHYDFGLRGYREAGDAHTHPHEPAPRPRRGYDTGFSGAYDRDFFRGQQHAYDRDFAPSAPYGGWASDERGAPRPNRVTASYNLDYVYGGRGPRYPVNYHPYAGDRVQRVGDLDEYRHPYTTIGGTRTWRGTPRGNDYDRDFGPRRRYGRDY